jgi:23S rRNA (guanosine2251-2'-O)-methyltransferase
MLDRKLRTHEMDRKSLSDFKVAEKFGFSFVLDDIRSALNVGSIFRTSDAFLFEKIHLCGLTAQPPSPEIAKSALGATESVEWQHWPSTKECLSLLKQTHHIIGIEITANALSLDEYLFNTSKPIAAVLGNEITGISSEVIELCDEIVSIPQFGTKHSLNVSVCAGIIGWSYLTRHI